MPSPGTPPVVRCPESIRKRIEGAAPLPELVNLGVHPVEGIVLVVGTTLELLAITESKPVSAKT
jgi:hypothetical protein